MGACGNTGPTYHERALVCRILAYNSKNDGEGGVPWLGLGVGGAGQWE